MPDGPVQGRHEPAGHVTLIGKNGNWPTYVPTPLTAAQIVDETMAH